MQIKYFLLPFACIMTAVLLISCQKNLGDENGGIPAVGQKPKQGTTWYYRYDTYYPNGGLINSVSLVYRAVSEVTYGGEKWLNIIDTATATTVYLLNVKTGGLFQYSNNNSYLFCKDPAALNDAYNSYNGGSAEVFVVKGVKDTLPSSLGNIVVNYYEGSKNGDIIDKIWYNENLWIARQFIYFRNLSNVYYRTGALFLQQIIY